MICVTKDPYLDEEEARSPETQAWMGDVEIFDGQGGNISLLRRHVTFVIKCIPSAEPHIEALLQREKK